MSNWTLIFRSLTHHWRMNLAVSLGVAAATAVLTGALLVGDSVRGSLRRLTLDRLGKIDHVLVQDRLFRGKLAQELAANPAFQQHYEQAVTGILFPQATVEHSTSGATRRASSVLVLGCDEHFWTLDTTGTRPRQIPGDNEIVLNESLAGDLRVRRGDTVTLRLPQPNQVPADSPLANKSDRVRGVTGLKVVDVIPAEGLGRFSLQASQSLPRNAFVSLATLQEALNQTDAINALFVSNRDSSTPTSSDPTPSSIVRPTLADLGINIKHVRYAHRRDGQSEPPSIDYFTVTTDRMIFSPDTARVIEQVVRQFGGQPALTYLANSIHKIPADGAADNHPGVPYSMITAIDPSPAFVLTDVSVQPIALLSNGEIVLNQWTAEDLHAQIGDKIQVLYFEPETTHGEAVERTAEFTLKAVAGLTKPVQPYRRRLPAEFDQPLTAANDPDLTPEVTGVTDQETIARWDAPFPFDQRRVRTVDDDYWQEYRTTPKAFISLATGQRLWGSRFGNVTSFRVPGGRPIEELELALQASVAAHASELGFRFIPIKKQQMDASNGTTPFDVLFLSLSFFVIAAALMTVALLFRLGIEQRSAEVGVLLALGIPRRQVGRLLVAEGTLVATGGAVMGIAVGIGYARLMLLGLSHWWLGAITTPFLQFHGTPLSLVLGYGLGVVISAATIVWTVRQTRSLSVRKLLSGQTEDVGRVPSARRHSGWVLAGLGLAMALSAAAMGLGGMAQAGAFVAGGAVLLVSLLLWIRGRLRGGVSAEIATWTQGHALWRLAIRNAARNPGRSVITIGLMASATFLIVSMSSFRLAPTASGVGGFQLVGQSSLPVYVDLNSTAIQQEYFGSQSSALADSTILGLRLRGGDDASCNNLYLASQPRVLGVTPQFIEYFDRPGVTSFSWAASAATSAEQRANPWRILVEAQREPDAPVPVVVDKNTAMFSLRLYRGIGEEFEFQYDGRLVRFQVAGLLENSMLQGSLLVGESDFRRLFPTLSGYRYFLIATSPDRAAKAAEILEDRLSDEGFDAVPTRDVLEQLLAVQNTYLSTFQSLGALGLLLGTFGLATIQLRNVLERRGELALLQAAGYRRRRLAELVLLENILLLVGGLGTGLLAALLAVLPHELWGEAAFSWLLARDLAVMLGAVLLVGLISSFVSVRAVMRLPLVASLRGE